MLEEKDYVIIKAIFNLQKWVKENLPIENSIVAYDLILLLSIHSYSNSKITVKHLFTSLPHSPTAVRYHYQRLLDDGWIEHSLEPNDKRIKYVRSTTKFIKIINAHTKATKEIIIKSAQLIKD
jgi:DNA-binding MarR family transcriptional regulator